MGTLLAFPSSSLDPYPRRYTSPNLPDSSSSFFGDEGELSQDLFPSVDCSSASESSFWSKEQVRTYMMAHSYRSTTTMAQSRQPFVGELVPLISPEDPDVTFSIKRLNTRDVMSYRNQNSQVRYIMEEDNERVITEKDYPMGNMHVDVTVLGLANWNITDNVGNPVPVSRETILSYLMPEELDAIYDKVIEVNPILTGEKARKKDSSNS